VGAAKELRPGELISYGQNMATISKTQAQSGARANWLSINMHTGRKMYCDDIVRIASKDSQLRRNKSKCRLHGKRIEWLPAKWQKC